MLSPHRCSFAAFIVVSNLFISPVGAGEKSFKDCPNCPEMVKIPAGKFEMGSRPGTEDVDTSEKPHHTVSIQHPFAIGKYEVTQGEFSAVMGYNPSSSKDSPKHPVSNITFWEAREFAGKLSTMTGKRYRLPTEAEWEYAARAGTNTKWYCGNNYKCVDGIAVFYYAGRWISPVGSKKPNKFGLHDVLGNVSEMVEDPVRYTRSGSLGYEGAPTDGSMWDCVRTPGRDYTQGSCMADFRGVRGGNHASDVWRVASAKRSGKPASLKDDSVGFRIVRDLDG